MAPCEAACWATAKPIPDDPPPTTPRFCCKSFPSCIEFSLCALLTYTVTDDQTTTCGSCIIVMAAMRLEKLRQVDLNLLITFAAIAEEKSVTAAAYPLLLSQPALSRAVHRVQGI